MKKIFEQSSFWIAAVFISLAAAGSAAAWYGHEQLVVLSQEVRALKQSLASTTSLLKDDIALAQEKLNESITKQAQTVDAKIGSVASQVNSVTGTIDTLQKLSKTDPELLAQYSKVYFLNEHYAPERLTQIPSAYTYSTTRSETIHALVWPHLLAMLEAAKAQGITLYIKSAYRSYDEQKALKGVYTVTYGAGTANQFSADQGYSEHQLGTTADFISVGQGGELAGFDKTAAYTWMLANAHLYGFILSYPKNNSSYIFEPWHWRYVGVRLATDLKNQGKNYYDLDQRTLDSYLVNIFD
jgi:LAS superfamily LD-carboxypeptidase LdcB